MSNLAEKQLPEHQGTSTDVADPEAQSAALHGSADTVMLQQILHSRRWRMLDRVDLSLIHI